MEAIQMLDPQILLFVVMILFVVLLLLIMSLWIKSSRMQKRYNQMLNGSHPGNIEELLVGIQQALNGVKLQSEINRKNTTDIISLMKKMKSRVGVLRYNAFSQQGSDLSFSIAILNDEQDGVLLTGIHSREETIIYAKPIEKGQSKYNLSPEEKQVIDQTVSNQN
jgi:hypothetical protein